MKKIINNILNSLGNGKAKIVLYNKSINTQSFLFNEVKSSIKDMLGTCLFFEFSTLEDSNNDIVDDLSDILKLIQDNRTVILINDLFSFKFPEAIINMFYGKRNVDVIITSNVDISYKLKEKDTQVRGRYVTFFLNPMIFIDTHNSDYHFDSLKDISSSDEAKKLYQYLVKHSGEVLTYRKIYKSIKINKSLQFYIDCINYMVKTYMIYMLQRIDIKTMKKLSSGFIFYPTFISDIDITNLTFEEKYKLKDEASLVARMISDGYIVNQAISYVGGIIDNCYKTRTIINRGFLIEYFDRKCIVCFNPSDEELIRFKKFKTFIPQLMLVLGEIDLRIDNDGIGYYGFINLLNDGLKGYANF